MSPRVMKLSCVALATAGAAYLGKLAIDLSAERDVEEQRAALAKTNEATNAASDLLAALSVIDGGGSDAAPDGPR